MTDTPSPEKTHYEILRVAPRASSDEIRAAYRQMSGRYHPDRNPGHPDAAARIMASINVAYDTLSDPDRRATYDDILRRPRVRAGGSPVPRSRGPASHGWTAEHDPAPFFGTHRDAVEDSMRRRAKALRRLIIASLLLCVAGLSVGGWMLTEPYLEASAEPPVRIVDARKPHGADARSDRPEAQPESGHADLRSVHGGHVRPLEAPNGTPWPSLSGEVAGYARRFDDGAAWLTLDNRIGPSDVFVKVYRVTEDGLEPSRHVFVRSREQFALAGMRAGEYEVRYLSLDTGQTLRSIRLKLAAVPAGSGQQSFRLDDMQGRSGRAKPITREDFHVPVLNLKLSREPGVEAAAAAR